jgi:hypothetical protein
MVAVQLFKGPQEPFLGMGSSEGLVDVWTWHADWQADLARYGDVDLRYPDMGVDMYPFEQQEGEGPPHAIERQDKAFLTGWAVGNLLSDPTRTGTVTAGSLQAKGFGTLTLRPKGAQVIRGEGRWAGGRWTVVLRRPLAVGNEEGMPLSPGDKLSIAFAIWEGSFGDRDGQKRISIWQDFELEKGSP